jgi:uncharacterized protein YbaR (Trm112 family)
MHWKELLDRFACPACKQPLELVQRESKDALKCTNATCRRLYPVQDDIPILLVDRATVEPE